MTIFSFHPVKHITTGEGGMITTNNEEFMKNYYYLGHMVLLEKELLKVLMEVSGFMTSYV